MNCPDCGVVKSRVYHTYDDGGVIRRRRKCVGCDYRWKTVERFAGETKVYNQRVKMADGGLRVEIAGREVSPEIIAAFRQVLQELESGE